MEMVKKETEKLGLSNNNNYNLVSTKEDHEEVEFHDEQQGKSIGNKNKSDQKTTLRTPADIYEHPSFYSFILDMPGLLAQNIKVKVEDGILRVTGKQKKQTWEANEGAKAIRLERRRARYMRKFPLPADVTNEDVKAIYKDGVLSITVAKKLPVVEQFNAPSLDNYPTKLN